MTIREFLDDEEMSARAFAEKVGVDPGTMSRWLSGESCPEGEHCARIVEKSNGKITLTDIVRPKRRPTARSQRKVG